MGVLEIVLIGIGVSMDAFAVSICKGLSIKVVNWKKKLIIAFYFGIFQAIMPIIGYLLGSSFTQVVQKFDHWIAFIFLFTIGANMIKNSFQDDIENKNSNIDVKTMTALAIATSIDALAIGITFAFLKTKLFLSVGIIGVITFLLSIIGVNIGNKFGDKFQSKAEILGGVVLIFIGLKILLEHLNCF